MKSDTPDARHEPFVSALKKMNAPPRLKYRAVYFITLAAAAVLPYFNSLRNGFVYDDSDQILTNPYVHDFHHLREIFTSSVWSFMGDFRGASNYYRPMMSVGYVVCYRLFGGNAWGFHLVNLALNAAVVLLVFLVTLRMFRTRPAALAVACVFALHPVHSEAVDWIAAVTELELALFFLLTFWLFLIAARPAGRSSLPLQMAMGASFMFALLSKEQALTLPLLAALYEHFFREDRAETTKLQKLQRYAVLWAIAAVYLGIRIRFLGGFAPGQYRSDLSSGDLLIAAMALIGGYGRKIVWPAQLCSYYVYPARFAALYWPALGGAITLGICLSVYLALRRFQRQAAFGVIWFLVTLGPVLNVRWMSSNPFAERYLYLSSLGFCWVVGWGGVNAWSWLDARGIRWRFALPIVAAATGALAAYRIVVRNRDWHDDVTFYKATLKVSPDAYYIYNNLGKAYWDKGDVASAEKEWRIALSLAPGSEYVLHNLGLVANVERRYAEAESLFLRALALRPDYSDAHLDLGKTLEATGRLTAAEAQLRLAERLSPLNVRAHLALSEFYFDRRRLPEAEEEALRSVKITPTPQGYWDLGLAEWLAGNRGGAERAFLEAERNNPADSRGHFMLGLLYMDCARYVDAARKYREGLQLDPNNVEALANLKKCEFLAGQR